MGAVVEAVLRSAPRRNCVSMQVRGVGSPKRCLGENRYVSPASESVTSRFWEVSSKETWNPPESETSSPDQLKNVCTPPRERITDAPGWVARCTVLTKATSTPSWHSRPAGTPCTTTLWRPG